MLTCSQVAVCQAFCPLEPIFVIETLANLEKEIHYHFLKADSPDFIGMFLLCYLYYLLFTGYDHFPLSHNFRKHVLIHSVLTVPAFR